ncbi:MAG: NAD+ kinase [Sphingobacteriales bacterium]|jgi:NAD+ kinase
MKIALYGRIYKNSSLTYVQELLDALEQVQAEIIIFKDYHNYLSGKVKIRSKVEVFSSSNELIGVDYLCSIGGDGTLLDSVRLVQDKGIPIIGINMGRLGFLAGINKGNIKSAINSLIQGHYVIDQRTMLQLEVESPLFEDFHCALNETTIHQSISSSMIRVHTYLNGEFLNSYWADGLIVATPTGSTGYSLSCGGPIIFPRSGNFVITPISPHNLNVRPVIISDESVVTFEVESRAPHFNLSLDSRTVTLPLNTQIAVKKAPFSLNLIRLSNENFLSTLREKLMWGLDSRNSGVSDDDKTQH